MTAAHVPVRLRAVLIDFKEVYAGPVLMVISTFNWTYVVSAMVRAVTLPGLFVAFEFRTGQQRGRQPVCHDLLLLACSHGSPVRTVEALLAVDAVDDLDIARNFTLHIVIGLLLHSTLLVEFFASFLHISDRTPYDLHFARLGKPLVHEAIAFAGAHALGLRVFARLELHAPHVVVH